jgi:hypothetical protein
MRIWLEQDVRFAECRTRGAAWLGARVPDDGKGYENIVMHAYEWALYELRHAEFVEANVPANWRWLHRPLEKTT